MTVDFETKDSGTRVEFETGAHRDSQSGKGRFDLLPLEAMRRVARLLERGADKYGDRNWELGMPMSRLASSMLRHAFQAAAGETDEDHLAAVCFNAMALIAHQERITTGALPAELDDQPKPQTKPSFFDEIERVFPIREARPLDSYFHGELGPGSGSTPIYQSDTWQSLLERAGQQRKSWQFEVPRPPFVTIDVDTTGLDALPEGWQDLGTTTNEGLHITFSEEEGQGADMLARVNELFPRRPAKPSWEDRVEGHAFWTDFTVEPDGTAHDNRPFFPLLKALQDLFDIRNWLKNREPQVGDRVRIKYPSVVWDNRVGEVVQLYPDGGDRMYIVEVDEDDQEYGFARGGFTREELELL